MSFCIFCRTIGDIGKVDMVKFGEIEFEPEHLKL